MSPRRWWWLALAGLAAAAAASTAPLGARQAAPVSERPRGVIVDFAAVQDDGTPVSELQVSEVEVRIDGRLRAVKALRRVAAAPIPERAGRAPRLPRPFGSNADVAAGRSFALIIDEASFTPRHEAVFRGAIEGLLPVLTPADRTIIVALPFGGIKVPFTSDPARIRQALPGLVGQGNLAETGSDMACRTRRFLEALDGFFTSQAGRSAPLTVAVFTAGLAAPRRDAPLALAPGMCELLVNHFQRVATAAGAARATFYVLQPTDITSGAAAWRESIGGNAFLGSDNPIEGIEHLAGSTGGARLALDSTGPGSLLRVARESAAYFEAELEPDPREVLMRSRSLGVRVRRPGVTVRVRPEITFAGAAPTGAAGRLSTSELLLSTTAATDLPLRVAGFTVREPGGQLRVGVVVEPVEPSASLTSVGAILIDRNAAVARWFAPDPSERPLVGAMAASAGSYRLRVAAADAAGRFGTAEDDVIVGLTSVGPLSLGSLLLGVSRAEGNRAQLQFSVEPTAIASFDIYGGTAGMGLTAVLEVARDADGPAIASFPLTLARADEGRVVATAAVPVGALAPGDYLIRGVIRLEDGTTGRVTRTLRKVAR